MHKGGGGHEDGTILMDVICVASLWNLKEFGQIQCIWKQKTLGFLVKKNRVNWVKFEFQTKYGEIANLLCFLCGNRTAFYMFRVSNGNTRAMCEIYSKLTMKSQKLLTLNRFQTSFWCFHCKCLVNSIELSYIKRWVDSVYGISIAIFARVLIENYKYIYTDFYSGFVAICFSHVCILLP